jgi:hypothetical protein
MPNVFTREEAKRTLDMVLTRYGIRLSDQPAEKRKRKALLAVPKANAAKLPPEPIKSRTAATKKPIVQAQSAQLSPPVDFEWCHHILATPASADVPPSNEATCRSVSDEGESLAPEYHDHHFVIRILECATPLHCQVSAETVEDARNQVAQMPNLIEWREISAQELGLRMR